MAGKGVDLTERGLSSPQQRVNKGVGRVFRSRRTFRRCCGLESPRSERQYALTASQLFVRGSPVKFNSILPSILFPVSLP